MAYIFNKRFYKIYKSRYWKKSMQDISVELTIGITKVTFEDVILLISQRAGSLNMNDPYRTKDENIIKYIY